MATKFKYNLEALEWDAKHMRNKEGVYCYCGLDYTDGDSMVKCQDCKQLFHWDCVPSIKLKPLKGDSFYKFQCSVCNSGNEIYERETISWVQAIHLVLYHLIKTEPEKKYFRWRENICATISENWESLMPGKAKTATWHNTVAGSLSTHHSRFKSGFDDTQQSGNWTLQEVTPPDSTPPKATGKAKESRAPRQRSDVKKPRKKTDLSAGSEAEKEILEVLNESRGSKRSTRHRVSFSDDESDSDVGKRKARRRRVDPKILDNDIDLLQSFELFTKLEKERLGGSSQVDKPEGFEKDDDLESLSSLSSLSTDSEADGIDFSDLGDKGALEAIGSDDDTDDFQVEEKPVLQNEAGEEFFGNLLGANATTMDAPHQVIRIKRDDTNISPLAPKPLSTVASPLDLATTPMSFPASIPGLSSTLPFQSPAPESRISPDLTPSPERTPVAESVEVGYVPEKTAGHMYEDADALNSSNSDNDGYGYDEDEDDDSDGDGGARSEDGQDHNDEREIDADTDAEQHLAAFGPFPTTCLDNLSPQPLFSSSEAEVPNIHLMSEQAQWEFCAKTSSSQSVLTSKAKRLRRRLELRRFKRMLGLRLFDIDNAVKTCMEHRQMPWLQRPIDLQAYLLAGGSTKLADDKTGMRQLLSESGAGESNDLRSGSCERDEIDRPGGGDASHPGVLQAESAANVKRGITVTAYANSFASRLMGRAILRDSLTSQVAKVSPFHGRLLRPYIWRDFKTFGADDSASGPDGKARGLAMLRVQRAIRSRSHPLFHTLSLESLCLSKTESIDYVFFQHEHLEQVNALLCRTFWPGIDMSEALLYPEFSIVALYKRTVIGCAFLTPEAYLTYIAVSAGWEGAGIAKFMIYHLTQTVPTKDLTLHVSATNLAMLLYQKFGFKPEKFAVNFYKSYLPESSRVCPNAFFMRLRRY
ncbi:hypothetical protein BX661DRAFT_183285 [Kickxella alabastrina]|uniref:uncharacterized protein n=1 Tax=Kickxella alabastrina TaxID=61397 RepID=UPI00221F7354|nr:uncharacterized protein BX661DRAFT_183285 [Kickxella alabastrina]KAI7826698.1 hypothetical protein BX661DRAFT_183285 [Kickxella alabastrina]